MAGNPYRARTPNIVLLLAAFVAASCSAPTPAPTASSSRPPGHSVMPGTLLAAGDRLPGFTAAALNGESNGPSREMVNVLAVTSPSCQQCGADLAVLHVLARSVYGVSFLYLDTQATNDQGATARRTYRAEPSQVLLDGDGSIAGNLGVTTFPTVFVAAKGGNIVRVLHGMVDAGQLGHTFRSILGPTLGLPTCAPKGQPWTSTACPESTWTRWVVGGAGGTITGVGDGIEPQRGDALDVSLDGWPMQVSAVSLTDMKKMGGWFSMGDFGAGMHPSGSVDGVPLNGLRKTGRWSWQAGGFAAEVYPLGVPQPLGAQQVRATSPPRSVIAKLVAASIPPVGPPSCTTADLTLGMGGVSEASGQNSRLLSFTNDSSAACLLAGYPGIALSTPAGKSLPFAYHDRGDQMVTSLAPRSFVLVPGRTAYALINKYRCDVGNLSTARSIEVSLPGSTAAFRRKLARYPFIGYCGSGDPGSLVSISPFEPAVRLVFAH